MEVVEMKYSSDCLLVDSPGNKLFDKDGETKEYPDGELL